MLTFHVIESESQSGQRWSGSKYCTRVPYGVLTVTGAKVPHTKLMKLVAGR